MHTNDFWMPQYKWQLVDWFMKYYKGKYTKSVFLKKNKSELYGWYMYVRTHKKEVGNAGKTAPKKATQSQKVDRQLQLFA